jgi:hypothetical protein
MVEDEVDNKHDGNGEDMSDYITEDVPNGTFEDYDIPVTEEDAELNNSFQELFPELVNSYREQKEQIKREIMSKLTVKMPSAPMSNSYQPTVDIDDNSVEEKDDTQDVIQFARRRKYGQAHRNKPRAYSDISQNHLKARASKEKRDWVLREIVSTEKTFVDSLKILDAWFMTPLKSYDIMPEQSWTTIFKHVELVISINTPFLYDLEIFIRQTDSGASTTLNIPEIFQKHMQSFRLYSRYINNYPKALQELIASRKNPVFKKWEEDISKEMFTKNFRTINIQSYLILPVQRIPRYSLLLDDLLKETPGYHAEHTTLRAAAKEIKQIAVYCNHRKSESESIMKIRSLQEKLKLKVCNFDHSIDINRILFSLSEDISKMVICYCQGQSAIYIFYQTLLS